MNRRWRQGWGGSAAGRKARRRTGPRIVLGSGQSDAEERTAINITASMMKAEETSIVADRVTELLDEAEPSGDGLTEPAHDVPVRVPDGPRLPRSATAVPHTIRILDSSHLPSTPGVSIL